MQYTARISIETSALLELVQRAYQEARGTFVSKGAALDAAVLDLDWTKDYNFQEIWLAIQRAPLPDLSDIYADTNAQGNVVKLEISAITRDTINEYKQSLPSVYESRSVRVGVVIREFLKAAYLQLNQEYWQDTLGQDETIIAQTTANSLKTSEQASSDNKPLDISDAMALVNQAQFDIDQILNELRRQLSNLSLK
ncbi:hypothetical protein [Weissella confusa]|uniref:Uncharacterized protein n=1 Tax=Weissella confusa TaxID=1583 RepID=A0AA40YW72_WEICO|nr:hypothetical protein [Weissella confusa]MBJ7639804.1 hypothetical protein [Weissella confusa]